MIRLFWSVPSSCVIPTELNPLDNGNLLKALAQHPDGSSSEVLLRTMSKKLPKSKGSTAIASQIPRKVRITSGSSTVVFSRAASVARHSLFCQPSR